MKLNIMRNKKTLKTVNKISLDASTICQLKCPACSTSKGIVKNGIIGSGFLSYGNFKTVVEGNPSIKEIELSNWGEIFLNPELVDIIKFAYEKEIKLTAGNGVNLNSITNETIEALVKYQFGYLNISIDGACQETYSQYRIEGNYDKVIENIRKINFYKEKGNSQLPKLSWQFIIFGHNEHEIPKVKKLCEKLHMVFNPKLNHSDFFPVKDKDFVRRESGLDVADREEYKIKNKKHYKRPCCQLWVSPQISWDGKLLGCCVNKWISFGNVFDNGLSNSLTNPLFERTKSVLKRNDALDKNMPCFHCPTYRQIIECPITDDEIMLYSIFIHPAEKEV
jgi:MoaA/NifB/PqqE/SkfB family radical SAM enzyme